VTAAKVRDTVHGAIIIDKPEGPTSFAAMRQAARCVGVRKSGHTGTLDPAASGVIVVLLGEATKLANVLVHDDKVYEARILLGVATDTLDREGQVVAEAPVDVALLTTDRVAAALADHVGEVMQVPPIYSALKRDGRTLMSRARAGEEVHVEARPALCHSLTLVAIETEPQPVLVVRVHCGKGYYVRSLARDLGAALDLPAHLVGLRRTRVGEFDLARAVGPDAATLADVIPIAELLGSWRHISVDSVGCEALSYGRPLKMSAVNTTREPLQPDDDRALALDLAGNPLALMRADFDSWKIERGFVIDIQGCDE